MIKIPITKGLFVLIDDEDYDIVSKHKWCASKAGNTHYAVSRIPGRNPIIVPMHRLIMKVVDSNVLVDHKDHNGLNNQRSNLRLSTKSQNAMNGRARKSTSNFLGVSYDKVNNKWRAVIKKDYKQTPIGRFSTEIEAAKAYDKKAKELFGEFANLNFKQNDK